VQGIHYHFVCSTCEAAVASARRTTHTPSWHCLILWEVESKSFNGITLARFHSANKDIKERGKEQEAGISNQETRSETNNETRKSREARTGNRKHDVLRQCACTCCCDGEYSEQRHHVLRSSRRSFKKIATTEKKC